MRLIRMEGETLSHKREIVRFPKCEYDTVNILFYAASKLKFKELRELRNMLFDLYAVKKTEFGKIFINSLKVGERVRYVGEPVKSRVGNLCTYDVGVVVEKLQTKVRVKFGNEPESTSNRIWRISVDALEKI